MATPIVLLTDFGTSDVYAGVMKGVIAAIAPQSRVIDLTHEVPAQDVRAAASALLFAHDYFPPGSVICCVVDPGVGTTREPVALELIAPAGTIYLVCPDNGLVTPLLELVRRAVVLDDPAFHLRAVSATFHGRDIFAPAAAHLGSGVPLERLGTPREPNRLATIEWPRARRSGDEWRCSIIHVDHFGNLITNLRGEELAERGGKWRVLFGSYSIAALSPTFGSVTVGEPVAYVGSSGYLELAVRDGNAAAELSAARGDELLVQRTGE